MTITRKDYMDGKITHEQYYEAVVDAIGRERVCRIVTAIASLTELQSCYATNHNLNNIKLNRWDAAHEWVRQLVGERAAEVMPITWNSTGTPLAPGTFCWSLSESVCVLKSAARRMCTHARET